MKLAVLLCMTSVAAYLAQHVTAFDCWSWRYADWCYQLILSDARRGAENGEMPRYTEGQLKAVCRAYRDGKSCLLRRNCTSEMTQGHKDLFGYLCDDSRVYNTYMDKNECLMSTSMNTSVAVCSKEYREQVQVLRPHEYGEKLCGCVKKLIACYDKALRKLCGDEFAAILQEQNVRLAQPMLEELNITCQLKTVETKENGATGVFLSFISAALGILLAILMYM